MTLLLVTTKPGIRTLQEVFTIYTSVKLNTHVNCSFCPIPVLHTIPTFSLDSKSHSIKARIVCRKLKSFSTAKFSLPWPGWMTEVEQITFQSWLHTESFEDNKRNVNATSHGDLTTTHETIDCSLTNGLWCSAATSAYCSLCIFCVWQFQH